MKPVDPTIRKETDFIALCVLILSALMESVYLIIGRWDLSVLFGNLLGGVCGVLNFFLMGLGLQKALGKDPKEAKTTVAFSHSMRFIMLAVVVVIAAVFDQVGLIPTALSLVFPSIGVFMRSFMIRKNDSGEVNE